MVNPVTLNKVFLSLSLICFIGAYFSKIQSEKCNVSDQYCNENEKLLVIIFGLSGISICFSICIFYVLYIYMYTITNIIYHKNQSKLY